AQFAGRFPSWLCLLLSNAILYAGLRSLRGARVALWTVIIYSTCTLVYVSSGAVLTDPFLALGTSLSLVSFIMAVEQHRSVLTRSAGQSGDPTGNKSRYRFGWWAYGFFLGLVIGLLAKGPL